MANSLIIVPARLKATRLPNKPMADIGGKPMIVHVWRRAVEADCGRVIVATDAPEIMSAIEAEGGEAQMTSAGHASGSDRIYEALQRADPDGAHDVIVNLQGDLPTLDPALVRACAGAIGEADIATLAAEIVDERERTDPNVVKAVCAATDDPDRFRALYFTRATAPWGDGPLYHHIGIYAYRRAALAGFVSLPRSPLEKRERLEQLRALEAGMAMAVRLVDAVPLGVDTPADLARARALLGGALSASPDINLR